MPNPANPDILSIFFFICGLIQIWMVCLRYCVCRSVEFIAPRERERERGIIMIYALSGGLREGGLQVTGPPTGG